MTGRIRIVKKKKPRIINLPEDWEARIKMLNDEAVRPYEIEDGLVELPGYEMRLERHPADEMLNVYQLFLVTDKQYRAQKNFNDDWQAGLFECDRWV